MSGFPVLHYLPEFAQTHVHCVYDAIQPSHPLLPPSPPALNLSQHQSFFQWVVPLYSLPALNENVASPTECVVILFFVVVVILFNFCPFKGGKWYVGIVLVFVSVVKAMVFPVVMYGCESWTVKKAEHRRIDAFFFFFFELMLLNCGVGEDS